MIDYNKLIKIYELSHQYAKINECRLELSQLMVIGSINDSCCFKLQCNETEYDFYTSDELIEKLTELTKQEPKYKASQEDRMKWYSVQRYKPSMTCSDCVIRTKGGGIKMATYTVMSDGSGEWVNFDDEKIEDVTHFIIVEPIEIEPIECQHEIDYGIYY